MTTTFTTSAWRERALELRSELQDVYSVFECAKALHIAQGDLQAAAKYLTDGNWRFGKLISWSRDVDFGARATTLSEQTGRSIAHCREVLLDCGGHEELARRKLLGLPLLKSEIAPSS